jgi:hypothetical protein
MIEQVTRGNNQPDAFYTAIIIKGWLPPGKLVTVLGVQYLVMVYLNSRGTLVNIELPSSFKLGSTWSGQIEQCICLGTSCDIQYYLLVLMKEFAHNRVSECVFCRRKDCGQKVKTFSPMLLMTVTPGGRQSENAVLQPPI